MEGDDTGSDLGMDEMAKVESFWGKTLSSTNKVFDWSGEDELEEGIESTLELRGACLGVSNKLKPKDRNVVAVTVENEDGDDEQFVIASLRLEQTEQVSLLLQLQPPVKFELVQGSGPVHLTGSMVSGFAMSGDEGDDDDEEEEEEEENEIENVTENKPAIKTSQATSKEPKTSILKRPAETPVQAKPSKVAKVEVKEEDEEEDKEVDESMEDNSDFLMGDLGDTDDEDDSDDEEEESEEEEEESEEEEVPPPPSKKKSQVKDGKGKKPVPAGLSRTPQPTPKNNKPPVKTSMSAQKPAGKNVTPNKVPLTVDQIKKKLIQSGNFPKKLDKFNNYMTHTFKVTDDNTKKQLWEYVQKNRK